jgi:DNA-binding MarR family transcriptional regulator
MANTSPAGAPDSLRTVADEIADAVDVLQEATRMLAGVALRSLEVIEGSVSLPQFRVLAMLAALGPARSARVAAGLGLEPSSVTRLVDRLMSAGHVTRDMDPSNRSAVILRLTASGQHIVDDVVAWRRRELRRILLRLAPGDRAALTASLGRLVAVSEGYGVVMPGPVPL